MLTARKANSISRLIMTIKLDFMEYRLYLQERANNKN